MAVPEDPTPVKLFVACLYKEEEAYGSATQLISERFGKIDYFSETIEFDVTQYYEPEMGPELVRRIISFASTISPADIVEAKLFTNSVEEQFLDGDGGRRINLDPGYMDHNKVVLASAKQGPQKIFLDQGIWADPTLQYGKGRFSPFEWTFPDFKDDRYHKCLTRIRELYKTANK